MREEELKEKSNFGAKTDTLSTSNQLLLGNRKKIAGAIFKEAERGG